MPKLAPVLALGLLLSGVPSAAAIAGPDDLEPIRRLVVDTVMPIPRGAYASTVCPNVGGFYTFRPPGVTEATGAGCATPWCHGPASVWCFNQDKLTQPDQAMCVTHQTLTPASVAIPGQDAVSPLYLRCVNPLYHLSVFGGICDEAAQVMCLRSGDYAACYAYSSMLGCTTIQTGPCRDAVQVACWGSVYVDGRPQYPAFCAVWIAAAQYCLTTTA